MRNCAFSVDKEKSVAIIKKIIKRGPKNSKKYYPNKLSIAFIKLSSDDSDDSDDFEELSSYNVDDYYDEIVQKSYGKCYDQGSLLIKKIELNDDIIELCAYLYEDYECDFSYPTFAYNDKFKSWIINDKKWAPNGIDPHNNKVIILNFNKYKLNLSNI
jgi:hypothetical protein